MIWGVCRSLTNASKKYDVTGFLYFSYKQAKLVRPDEPKSKIWGVLGGYPLIVTAYVAAGSATEGLGYACISLLFTSCFLPVPFSIHHIKR